MNLKIYIIIFVVLVVFLILYYVIQKPKSNDIIDTYSRYLLRETNPATAFTYKSLGNGQYENYYLNYDPNIPDVIRKEVNDYPVDSTGIKYTPLEHGTVTESENGFRISGVDTIFDCPTNWIWNTIDKTCNLKPICNSDENNMYKGLDLYYFNLNEVQNKIPVKTNKNSNKNVKYHDRLYISCLENENYDIEECELNTLYNQLQIQPNTNNPCQYYDICEDLNEYTIHTYDIGNGVQLKENEYYLCINSVSELQTCKDNSIFNQDLNGCVENNPCANKENNYTFPIDDKSYISCINGQQFTVNCQNNVYDLNGSENLECQIDKSQKYIDYFRNNYFTIPISLYEYQNNKKQIFSIAITTFTRSMTLDPNTSTFFKNVRNLELYPPFDIQSHFVAYEDENTLEKGISVELNVTNYKPFAKNYLLPVSYYKDSLNLFTWNLIEDKPVMKTTDKFYKYNNNIKHIENETINFKSIDYFYFTSNSVLYKPNETFVTYISSDCGILHYADFVLPAMTTLQKIVRFALQVLFYKILSDGNYLIYFINPFNLTICAIVWNKDLIIPSVLNFGLTITPKMFNYKIKKLPNNRNFHIRLSSINWYGDTNQTNNYVLPEMMLMITFNEFIQLDKQFMLINSIPITNKVQLNKFRKETEKLYTPNQKLTGDYNYLLNIQQNINTKLLTKYE